MQAGAVAVTGLGVVAPCGIGKEAFWRACSAPVSAGGRASDDRRLGPVARTTTRPRTPAGPTASSSSRSPPPPRRSSRPASSAADPARIGTIFGTGVGGIHTLEEQIQIRLEKGERRVSPFLVPMMMANAAGAAVSMRFGLQGPNETICTACAAGTHALGYAARLIAWGHCRRRASPAGTEARRHGHVARRLRQHDRPVDQRAPAARSTSTATGS